MGFNIEEYAKQNTLMLANMNNMIIEIEDKATNKIGKELNELIDTVKILKNDYKLSKIEIGEIKEDCKRLKEDNVELINELHTLGNKKFTRQWGAWKVYANSCLMNNIFKKDKTSAFYILFHDRVRKWMYTDASNAVGADTPSRIHISDTDDSDYKTSMGNLKHWRIPPHKLVKAENEFIKLYNNGNLLNGKNILWENYLEEKFGGKTA